MKAYFLWLFKTLTLLVLFVVVVPILIAAVISASQDPMSKEGLSKDNKVAIIELTGVITDSKDFLEELHRQIRNENVKGIVVRIDSPGGSVGPSQDIYSAIKTLKEKKPIIASMGSVAASGGLYAAMGASKVYCQPGTITGSIGVILQIPNFSGITEKVGVEVVTIKAGKYKDVGNSFRQMTEEERALLDDTANKAHKDFIAAVADGRGLAVKDVETFADGRIILGSDAMKLKLVDSFGDVYAAAREVFAVRGEPLPEGVEPEVFYPEDKFGEVRRLFEGIAQFLPLGYRSPIQLQYIMY